MCHCQPATALRSGQSVLILGIQHEVLPFSPLWLHVRTLFPFAKNSCFSHVLCSTFFHVPRGRDLHSGLASIQTGNLYKARYFSGKVRNVLVSMVYLVQSLVRISGRKGPPFLKRPLGTGEIITHNVYSGLPKYHTLILGQENSHPRFGIIMICNLRCRHVVRSDFCCLLYCCYLSMYEIIMVRSTTNLDLSLDFLCLPH